MSGYERKPHPTEDLRLEAVVACVGMSDILDDTLRANHPHVDTLIVVTSPEDKGTQAVARKHAAVCVPTDLFGRDNAPFNKGAALNAGYDRFRFFGWRLHLDVDILLPPNFRRVLFNHTHLDKACIYGADRVDVLSSERALLGAPGGDYVLHGTEWLHRECFFVESAVDRRHGARFVDPLRGWIPNGYFQLWHAEHQKVSPNSLGTAAHDDTAFAAMWPAACRRLLPETIVYHLFDGLVPGANWGGVG